ncbi:PD-(D/E)XK nuclease family protein [Amnibacterium flavum]|uniref:DNA 3'-5' helicase n=1 Tax=Amnibacterium flavum TaxID=2173173 RepID=A0A2V1HRQ4_9MICO|nr:ATP-dependent DNA helicase [Amnibacterium flavum]PVZ93789.1 ATP-dependent DNA helicase [Amnibacterium flavum]
MHASADPTTTALQVELDPSQRAVLALRDDESAVVIGAPGTGKTATLLELLAERVLSGRVAPSDALVLASSRVSATRLRDTIALRLGIALPGPLARTAASVASEIARADAVARGLEAPRLLTGAEQDLIFADLLSGYDEEGGGPAWPATLPAEVRRLGPFRTELRELLARVEEANLGTDGLRDLGAETGHPEWLAAADFFDDYHAVLDSYRSGSRDSTELLAEAAAIVNSGTASRMPRLVLVDDAQELTLGAIELLSAWARAGATVIAFGDPDIGVAGFRGGRADLLGSLDQHLGVPMRMLLLDQGYRSAGPIAALVAEVTSRVGAARTVLHRSPPAAIDAPIGEVVRIEAPTRAEEIARLARRLRELHVLGGVAWNSMAVVLRSGRHVPSFARGLSAAGVATRMNAAARSLREEWAADHLVRAVAVAIEADIEADTVADLLLGPFGGLDPLALRRLRLALRHEEVAGGGNRPGDALLVEAMAQPGRFATIDSPPARRAGRLAETLATVRALHESGATIEEMLWAVWERSGLAAQWAGQADGVGVLADEANRHLDSVVSLFASAQRYVERTPDRPPIEFIAEFRAAELPEDSLVALSRPDAVLVCAPSAVVGAEFDVVAVSALQDGIWPNLRLRSSLLHADRLGPAVEGVPLAVLDDRRQVLHDELRMFALSASRARRTLIISNVSSADEQPSPLVRLVPDDAPQATISDPLTLRGMVGALRRELAGRAGESASPAASALSRLAHESVPGADPASWYGLAAPSTDAPLVDLDDAEARVSVSPSRLGAVEKSPLGWFIDTMSAAPSGFHADLGTLLHSAMETLSTTPGAALDTDAVMEVVDARWHEFRFDSEWESEYQRSRARIRAAGLADYLSSFERDGHRLAGAETAFTFELGQAVVVGKIDRIEHTAAGSVVIVDLKTGTTFPRDDELPTHAQLGLYQLAAVHGGIEGMPEGAEFGGAKLLFVSSGVRGKLYREKEQPALGPEQLEEFRARVRSAAETMAGTLFPGVDGLAERDPLAGYPYRVHLIPAVSS